MNQIADPVTNRFSLRLFSLGADRDVLQHPWERVSGSDKKLLQAISEAPQKPRIQKTDFWSNPDFQFYQNPIGRERILREINALKQAGWRVSTTRRKSDSVLLLNLAKGETQLQMELPPEFPLNPPNVFANGLRLASLGIRGAWNSLCPLTEWAEYSQNIMIVDRLTKVPWRQFCRFNPLFKE